jgi:hypothetical protein
MGYTVSETDKCVFIKQVGQDKIFTLLLHVDDILVLVDAEEADLLFKRLKHRFGEVQFEVGDDLSYLGMNISIRDEGTVIDMSFYVSQVLENEEVEEAACPMAKTFYNVDEKLKKLGEVERKWFHSKTVKLLYLAKRARPDILTAVIFLCTHVQESTYEDKQKLQRVLGYLKMTVDRTLLLRTPKCNQIVAYIDAAYAAHEDTKSHSGILIYVGDTLAYVASKKQKCLSKSPMEAELIALMDNLGLVERFKEFLEFITQSKIPAPVVYQDCSAVVSLVTQGGGKTQTKHLRARMNLVTKMVDEGRVEIKHIKAPEMKADGLSKPYEANMHGQFAKSILGEKSSSVNRWALQ